MGKRGVDKSSSPRVVYVVAVERERWCELMVDARVRVCLRLCFEVGVCVVIESYSTFFADCGL